LKNKNSVLNIYTYSDHLLYAELKIDLNVRNAVCIVVYCII
jgi:hypothetical protein